MNLKALYHKGRIWVIGDVYWIFIMDLTVGLGKQKALVILGVSQEHLKE